MRTPEEYQKVILQLFPRGRAWSKDDGTVLYNLALAMADEFSRIEGRGEDLFDESLISKTIELLEEHEEDYGIYSDSSITIAKRRETLKGKLLAVGNQYDVYYEELADGMGYEIIIETYKPFWSGIGVSGDPCGEQWNIFYWKIRVNQEGNKGAFRSGAFSYDFSTMALNDTNYYYTLIVSFTDLMDQVNLINQGHLQVLYDWYGGAFNRGFNFMNINAFPTYDGKRYPGSFERDFGDGFCNLRDYDGQYLIGPFGHGFNISYDAKFGGCFLRDDFSSSFDSPS